MTELPTCRHGNREKRTYRSLAQANRARIKAGSGNRSLPKFRAYKCPRCGYYHLTKNV